MKFNKKINKYLGCLALFGTALGGVVNANGCEAKMETKNSNTDCSRMGAGLQTKAILSCLSPTVQDIKDEFGDVFSEVNQDVNSGRMTHILTKFDRLGVKLKLLSENNVPHKYVTSALPEDEYDARVVIYKKLIHYVVKARLNQITEELKRDLSDKTLSDDKVRKFNAYKKMDDQYITDLLRSKDYEEYFRNPVDWISECMSNRNKNLRHFLGRKSTLHMFNHKSAWTSLRKF